VVLTCLDSLGKLWDSKRGSLLPQADTSAAGGRHLYNNCFFPQVDVKWVLSRRVFQPSAWVDVLSLRSTFIATCFTFPGHRLAVFYSLLCRPRAVEYITQSPVARSGVLQCSLLLLKAPLDLGCDHLCNDVPIAFFLFLWNRKRTWFLENQGLSGNGASSLKW
jgi:hypothetical protein